MTLANIFGRVLPKKNTIEARFSKEVSLSRHIPISHFNTEHIFETKQGSMGCVFKIEGVPFEVTSNEDINYLQERFAFLLKNLDDEFAVYVTTYRHEVNATLSGKYPEGFAKDFSFAYQEKFKNKPLFVNDIYLTLLLKPGSTKVKKGISFIHKLSSSKTRTEYNEWRETQLRKLKNTMMSFTQALSDYSARLLGVYEDTRSNSYSEILSFLSILVNGKSSKYLMPYQDISSLIPCKRLYFGERAVHFEGRSQLDQSKELFSAIISIKDYYPKCVPGLFNGLLALPFSYINTHSFIGIDKSKAQETIVRQQNKMISVGDKSRSQMTELSEAADDLASDRLNFGLHHNTLMVFANSLHELEERVAKTIKLYSDIGIVAVRETLNLENAFWAQIPGNFRYVKRQSLISNQNFSCFCSLHNFYTGYTNQNHLGEAIMLAETRSKTPFYFNLHERASGRVEDISRGHTTLIGPTGAGKTVLMMAIDLMSQKFGGRTFIFDRNRGCDIYVRAMGGKYIQFDGKESVGFNPFQLEDMPQNRRFLRDFIKQLSSHESTILNDNDERQIADVVDRNFTLPFEKRTLSNIASFIRLDFTGFANLSKWLRALDRNGKAGEYGWLFDNDTDTLNLNHHIVGFDMTHLLNSKVKDDVLLTPVMMYLFHRIENILDGKLTKVLLDEAWQFLNNDYWLSKLDEYLVTWRKLNALIFFATQLPDKIAKSPLAPALIQGSATTLFLCNSRAEEKDYIETFKLSKKEFEFIKNSNNAQNRYFIYKQGHEAAIIRLDLKGMEKYTAVLSSNTLSLSICDELRKESGNVLDLWLPKFYERVTSL